MSDGNKGAARPSRLKGRATIVVGALVLIALAAAIVMAGRAALSAPQKLDFQRDDDAPTLAVRSDGGTLEVQPGSTWLPSKKGFQVQLAGSSNPRPEIERIDFADGAATVYLKRQGSPQVMDLALTEYEVEAPKGDLKVERVVVDYGDGSTSELSRADGSIPVNGAE